MVFNHTRTMYNVALDQLVYYHSLTTGYVQCLIGSILYKVRVIISGHVTSDQIALTDHRRLFPRDHIFASEIVWADTNLFTGRRGRSYNDRFYFKL